MKDFETYAAHERLASIRANAARKLTRQQRAQRRRFYRRTSAVFLILLLCLCSALWGMAAAKAIDGPQETRETVPMETPAEAESVVPAPAIEPQEGFENERIEDALLSRSSVIDDCTITFYCAEQYPHICGTGDGIAYDGTPVLAWATCAVDPSVIPLGSTVLVDLGDGEGLRTLVANDTGVKGNHIDISVPTHDEALRLGIRTSTVYWCKERPTRPNRNE